MPLFGLTAHYFRIGIVCAAAVALGVPPALSLGATATGEAVQPYQDQSTPEGWAWARIRQGIDADFNVKCRAVADPNKADDPAWRDRDNCRTVNAEFLVDILTRPPLRDQITFRGATLRGAKLVGDVDLAHARIATPVAVENSRLEGSVSLVDADAEKRISFNRSHISGSLNAAGLQSRSSLYLYGLNLPNGGVDLSFAVTASFLDARGATVAGVFNADSLRAGHVLLRSAGASKASFASVILRNAKVEGTVDLVGAAVAGVLNADSLRAGHLFLQSDGDGKARFGSVILRQARVEGIVDLDGATVTKDLDANVLQAGNFLMRSDGQNQASAATVILHGAKVDGQISMVGASVANEMSASSLQVGDLFLRSEGSRKTRITRLNLNSASIKGSLDLRGASLSGLDLRRATIGGELQLGDANTALDWLPGDRADDVLDLRNARVGSFSDNEKSWPPQGRLRLDGFSFTRFGGNEAPASAMIGRGAAWWDREWARRDAFSPWPYEQLALVFAAAGAKDAVEEIRYLESVRADEKAEGWSRVSSGLMRWVAGYGVGGYMFRALYCALAAALLAAAYLKFRVKGVADAGHGSIWCFGAAVNQLLPVINIRKEFADFFDDATLNRFTPWQSVLFTMLKIFGWALGGIVLAAMATITHG